MRSEKIRKKSVADPGFPEGGAKPARGGHPPNIFFLLRLISIALSFFLGTNDYSFMSECKFHPYREKPDCTET